MLTANASQADDAGNWIVERLEWNRSGEGVSKVTVTNTWGELRVRRSDTDEIRVSAHAQRDSRWSVEPRIETSVETGTDGETLALSVDFTDLHSTPAKLSEAARIDMTVLLPADKELEARVDDDLLQARGLRSSVTASSESGNLDLSSHGRIIANSRSGRIAAAFLSADPEPASRFETRTGDVVLWLAWDADVAIEASTEGRITSDVSTEISRPHDGPRKTARAIFGAGSRAIEVHSINGNFSFLRRAR